MQATLNGPQTGGVPDAYVPVRIASGVFGTLRVRTKRPLELHALRGNVVHVMGRDYEIGCDPVLDASSFACVAHHDPFDPRNIGPQRAYKPGK